MADIKGSVVSAVGTPVGDGSVKIQLCNYGAQVPRDYLGLQAPVENIYDVEADGSFEFAVSGNNIITPLGTYYVLTVMNGNGDVTQCNAYVFVDTETYDLTTYAPFNPIIPPPELPLAIVSQILIIAMPDADPGLDGSLGTTFQMTLNVDVTGAFLQNIIPGNLYTFIITQDATGGHQFVWPSGPAPYNLYNATAVCQLPNSTTVQTFVADANGVLWAIAPGTWWTS